MSIIETFTTNYYIVILYCLLFQIFELKVISYIKHIKYIKRNNRKV